MKLKWKCSKCNEEQATYLVEADWTTLRDRCGDIESILIIPKCVYCGSEDTYEELT
jgi:hypothetical protein